MVDTVLNDRMKPVFSNEPAVVLRRLRASHPENWDKVLIGETQQIVTVSEYLYREKYQTVIKTLEDLLKKNDLPVFKRDPARFQLQVERTARQLIEKILD